MKTLKLIIGALALAGAITICQAQTVNSTNSPQGWISYAGQTNWVVSPGLYYDNTDKKFGVYGAALYKANDNLYVGARATYVNGQATTAGVQAQLQTSFLLFNAITVVPFMETSTGLGKNTLYATAGGGGVVSIKSFVWKIGPVNVNTDIGIVAGAEHVVNSNNNTPNYNAIFGGPILNFTF